MVEEMKQALHEAFRLGQEYWYHENAFYTGHYAEADKINASFGLLVNETLSKVNVEEAPRTATKTTLAVAQPAPPEWNKKIRDGVDLLLKQAGLPPDSSARHQLSLMNFDAQPALKPLSDTATAVIDAARAAMDESQDRQISGGVSIPSHLAAALSLRLDEHDAVGGIKKGGGV